MFKMTDSSDKLQIGNCNLWHVRDLEVTMQAQHTVLYSGQVMSNGNLLWMFCCMRRDFTNRDNLVVIFLGGYISKPR